VSPQAEAITHAQAPRAIAIVVPGLFTVTLLYSSRSRAASSVGSHHGGGVAIGS
jgi:hypothetical protein